MKAIHSFLGTSKKRRALTVSTVEGVEAPSTPRAGLTHNTPSTASSYAFSQHLPSPSSPNFAVQASSPESTSHAPHYRDPKFGRPHPTPSARRVTSHDSLLPSSSSYVQPSESVLQKRSMPRLGVTIIPNSNSVDLDESNEAQGLFVSPRAPPPVPHSTLSSSVNTASSVPSPTSTVHRDVPTSHAHTYAMGPSPSTSSFGAEQSQTSSQWGSKSTSRRPSAVDANMGLGHDTLRPILSANESQTNLVCVLHNRSNTLYCIVLTASSSYIFLRNCPCLS